MALAQIEQDIYSLPFDDKLWLLERLVQHIRQAATVKPSSLQKNGVEADLEMMSNNPEIQTELNELSAWQETAYLLSDPANAAHLEKSVAEAREGKAMIKALIEEKSVPKLQFA